MKPRAFIAMPYRRRDVTVGSRTAKVDFDAIYKTLIDPAVRAAGCEPFRADEEAGAGDIRIDMFFELVTADIVIADVSILNTNVFYELGIRHGVSPRGVFLVSGGWQPLPFDNAPDRTFQYNGSLFELPRKRNHLAAVGQAVTRLAAVLEKAIDAEETTIGSPVYAQLPGLKPPDISTIATARSKYFGGLRDNWAIRVRHARRQGRPEDILTLAESAPTRFQRHRMVYEAARALMELQRFAPAYRLFGEVLREQPGNVDAACQLGLALGRLGKIDEAADQMARVAQQFGGNPEMHGTLGRAFKDMWRLRFEQGRTTKARCRLALEYASYVTDAINSYRTAHRLHPGSYYNGINELTLLRLITHARAVDRRRPARPKELAGVVNAVRFAATAAHERAAATQASEDVVWTAGTLGELSVVTGDAAGASKWYREAAFTRDVTYFQLDSMLGQLRLFRDLGCETRIVEPVMALLGKRLAPLRVPQAERVVVASWASDASQRSKRRTDRQLRRDIRSQLAHWKVQARTLAVCAPLTPADLTFAEECLARRANVRLLLPRAEPEFIGRYLRAHGRDAVERYLALRTRADVRSQADHLGSPEGMPERERNDRWLVNTACTEARVDTLHTLLWGVPERLLSEAAERINELGGRVAYIEP